MTHIYSLRNVQQCYDSEIALHIPCLDISTNSIVGISGPNGSGKSTLLRILAFLDMPHSGDLLFDGTQCPVGEASTLTSKTLIRLRRQVTLLNQDPYLLKRSVLANVLYGLKVRGEKNNKERAAEALTMVGLDPDKYMSRPWFKLSGGEARRVAMAARLILQPKVMLLDEPTASLDEESTELIKLAALAARGKWNATIVVVSHDMLWLEGVAEHVVHVVNGRIAEKNCKPATV